MINVSALGIKPYKFRDGDKVITTNNPSQDIYLKLAGKSGGTVESMEVISEVMNHMLKEEDKHYIKELDFTTQLVLVQDYFQYHSKQMEDRFPNTNNTR